MFWDPAAESVETIAEKRWLLEKLRDIIKGLSKEEKELIVRLYLYEESLRAIARSSGVPVTTLQARHQRLLKKLRKEIEK